MGNLDRRPFLPQAGQMSRSHSTGVHSLSCRLPYRPVHLYTGEIPIMEKLIGTSARVLFIVSIVCIAAILGWPIAGLAVQSGAPTTIASVDPSYLQLLHWRMAGPSRGGRVVAVARDPANQQVFYFGATGCGIWKTDDGGIGWHNISDGFVNTGSVGALAVAPSNSNVIYAGMGEACVRADASYGDGIYKSTDAGKTWTHVALEATRSIARVRVNPKNPDLVYVAALGDPWGPSSRPRDALQDVPYSLG